MTNIAQWWQHLPEHINPVFVHFGPLQIRYYGLMYLTSFIVAYGLLLWRVKKEKLPYTTVILEDYFFWVVMGAVIGARIGYVLFYDLMYFVSHPLEIIWPFHSVEGEGILGLSGLSYHGGLIGAVLATKFFCDRHKLPVFRFGDLIVSVAPLGYTFGRIGNFLNGELYGRVTHVPWGMYFPMAPTYELRHPSQLYEALFEGLVLFAVVWSLKNKKVFDGFLFCVYVIGYGFVRFFIENFREPDEHLGFVFFSMSMGQVLCILMMLAGAYFIIRNIKSKKSA